LPELEVSQDLLDDRGILDEGDDAQSAAAFGAGEGISKVDLANEACPGASGVAAEIVRFRVGQRDGCGRGRVLLSLAPLPAGLVAIVAAVPDDLLSLFRDEGGQGGQGVQRGEAFRRRRREARVCGGARVVGDDASVAVVVESCEGKRGVNEVRGKPFPRGAVFRGDALSLVGRKTRMVKAVEDVQGGLADTAATEQVTEQAVSEEEHEAERIEGRDGLEVALGVPDAPAGKSMDMRMEIEAVAVALNRNDTFPRNPR
jgi:hypothetical protein